MTFWSTFSERLNSTLKNADVSDNFLRIFKTFLPIHRSLPIPGDHRRSLVFKQRPSGAVPATMGDCQRFLKRLKALTRTSWCDGSFKNVLSLVPQNFSIFRRFFLSLSQSEVVLFSNASKLWKILENKTRNVLKNCW